MGSQHRTEIGSPSLLRRLRRAAARHLDPEWPPDDRKRIDREAGGGNKRGPAGSSRKKPPQRGHPSPPRDPSSVGIEVLDRVVFDGPRPHVVLMLQGFEPSNVFAGIRTTVLASAELAAKLGLPLRVLVVDRSGETADGALSAIRRLIQEHRGDSSLADSMRVSTHDARDDSGYHPDDVWVATYWPTAYALKSLVRKGLVDPGRVIYLIQDFEPGFYPWGPLYAKALSTYAAGFIPLVNSRSLAAYLEATIGYAVDSDATFAPAVDPAPLHRAAERWLPDHRGRVRLLFYARPSKPRNMYSAGVEALRLWADRLPKGIDAVVRFAGAAIDGEVDLGPRVDVEMMGKLDLRAYYDLLADTDVGLALMLSPHPGHLALELPMAGIPTVTNELSGYRARWVDGLELAGTDAENIADALLDATERARGLHRHVPGAVQEPLGTTLERAVAHAATALTEPGTLPH